MPSRAGRCVTETLNYDGGRQVTVYVPPDPPRAIVFAGDGQMVAPWGADLEASDLPATLIVGVHRVTDEMLRLHEYSPGLTRSGSPRMRRSSSRTCGHGCSRTFS